MTRFFFNHPNLKLNHTVVVEGVLHHKMRNVLRLRVGESLYFFNNTGCEFFGKIVEQKKFKTHILIMDQKETTFKSHIHITLAQALTKGKKFDWLLQKATELGVRQFVPLIAQRNIIQKVSPGKIERWNKIVVHASQQSGRNDIPIIVPMMNLREYLKTIENENAVKILLAEPHLVQLKQKSVLQDGQKFIIMVGPEGGFSADEFDSIIQAHFHPITLGALTMRSETAPLALISILQYRCGEFKF